MHLFHFWVWEDNSEAVGVRVWIAEMLQCDLFHKEEKSWVNTPMESQIKLKPAFK